MSARSITFSSSRTLPGPIVRLERAHHPSGYFIDLPPEFALAAGWIIDHTSRGMSSATFAQRRQRDGKHVEAVEEVFAETASPMARSRLRFVAAMTRTSEQTVRVDPTRFERPVLQHTQQLDCTSVPSSPISSRNSVPPWAASNRPARPVTAPVNAPFSWPNNSLSIRVDGIAAQLTRTNARRLRGLR